MRTPRRRASRREFLKRSATALSGLLALSARSYAAVFGANGRLALGIIGVANRGADNLEAVFGETIAALCDVDEAYLAAASKRFPGAKTYSDFRKLFETKGLDAVVISTPDHTHAPAAALAMHSGLHVYCEKPLAHSVFEARALTKLAAEKKRITQLGTQIHAGENYRRVVELLRSGAIGDVSEVHVWCDRVWSGGKRPSDRPPLPKGLAWDLWLGPAPERPYHPSYVPMNWRGWWDFGNGTLGDMACHHMDLAFWALDLKHPVAIETEGPPVDEEAAPPWLIVRYTFRKDRGSEPVRLTWYHGGKRPPHFHQGKVPAWGDGTLFVGKKGLLLCDYGRNVLLPEKDFEDFKRPESSISPSIGHHREWLVACKDSGSPACRFEYSGPLTEAVLLGAVAYRSGARLEWDAASFRVKGPPSAERFLRREYRKGWIL